VSARSYPGRQLLRTAPPDPSAPAPRARQERDAGHHGSGYLFGAFRPATGEAFTAPYDRRTAEQWVTFLERVEAWVDPTVARVYAIVDNLQAHHARDVLLFSLMYPRWEFVFLPSGAAYLNLIEPWWKIVRSLALKGCRFTRWAQVQEALQQATDYWNAHRHPFHWGRRRRHRPRRQPGLAALPAV
jgi:DDE superfamily endonuclease